MGSSRNDAYSGLLDDYYLGLLGDADPRPPPLPPGFHLERKPPVIVNAAAHFCGTQAPGRSVNCAVPVKHEGGGAAAEEHRDVGGLRSPYLRSGIKEEGRDGCGIGAAHWRKHSSGERSDGGISSLLDKSTEPFEHLQGDGVKTEHHQQQNNGSCAPSTVGFRLQPRWKRALLKIGGSVLAGSASGNVDPQMIMLIAKEVQVTSRRGVQVAIVVGSRNIYCGDTWAAETGIEKVATCPIRQMASVMNAVLLQASLAKMGTEARVQTTLLMQDATEPYNSRQAMRHLEKGRVVIFGGIGAEMGNPLLTTDAAAAFRASEINADVFLKGITGDGQYGCALGSNANAEFEHFSYQELVARGFGNMNAKAISSCKEKNIPFVVFNMLEPGNISRALCGDPVGTLVDQTGRIS